MHRKPDPNTCVPPRVLFADQLIQLVLTPDEIVSARLHQFCCDRRTVSPDSPQTRMWRCGHSIQTRLPVIAPLSGWCVSTSAMRSPGGTEDD